MSFLKKHKEIILYLVFGVLTTVVNFVAFFLFGLLLSEELYLVSNLLAWAVAVIFAFVVNKLFVFEERSLTAKAVLPELAKFVFARVFSLCVEEVGLFLLVDTLRMGELSISLIFTFSGQFIAKCILAVIVIVMNYFFSKFIIFKKQKSGAKVPKIKDHK